MKKIRSVVYDVMGVGLLLGSIYFFYKTMEFLALKDYVAGALAMVVGFLVIRVGVEISKMAIVIQREE